MRDISVNMVAALQSLQEDQQERRARRAPIASRADKAAGSCVSAEDRKPGEVRSVSIAEYLNGK